MTSTNIWQQNLDGVRAHIERVEQQLAEADALIACHAFTIDPTPPEHWPKGSILSAAIARHNVRCLAEINRSLPLVRLCR